MANRTRSLPELSASRLPPGLEAKDWLCVDGIQFDTSHGTEYQATVKVPNSDKDVTEPRDATRPFSHRNIPFRSLPIDQAIEAAKTKGKYRQGEEYLIFRAKDARAGLFIGANTKANRKALEDIDYTEEESPPYAHHATGNINVVTHVLPEFLPPPENVQFSLQDRRKHQEFFNRMLQVQPRIRAERIRAGAAGAFRYRFSNPNPPSTQPPSPTPSPQVTPAATPNPQASQTSASHPNAPPTQSPSPMSSPQTSAPNPNSIPTSSPQTTPAANSNANPQASQGAQNPHRSQESSADSGQRRRRRRPRIANKINIQVSGRDSTFNTTPQNSTPDQSYRSDEGSSRNTSSATDDSSFNATDDSIDGDFEIVRDSSDASSDAPVFVSLPFSNNSPTSDQPHEKDDDELRSEDQLSAGDMNEHSSPDGSSDDETTLEGGHSDNEPTPEVVPSDDASEPEAPTDEGAPLAEGSNLEDDDEIDPYAVLFEDDEPSPTNESPEVDDEPSHNASREDKISAQDDEFEVQKTSDASPDDSTIADLPAAENDNPDLDVSEDSSFSDGDSPAPDTSPKEESSPQTTAPSPKTSSESVPNLTEEAIEELPTGVESLQKKIKEAKKKLKRKDISALTRENISTELKGWESELKSMKSFISRNKDKKRRMIKERAELRRSKVPTSDPRIVLLDEQILKLTIVIKDLLV